MIFIRFLGFWGLLNLQPNFWFNYPSFLFHRLFKFVIRILIKFFKNWSSPTSTKISLIYYQLFFKPKMKSQ